MLSLLSPQSKRYKRKPKATRDNGSLGPGGERTLSIPQITYDHIDDKDGVFSEESTGNISLPAMIFFSISMESDFYYHRSCNTSTGATEKCLAYHNTIYFAFGSFIDNAVFDPFF